MCALYSYSIISSIAKPSNNRYPFSRRKRKPMKLQTTTTMSHPKSNYKSPDSENLNPLRIRAQKNHRSAGSECQQSFLQKHTYINRFANAQTHQHLPSKLFEFKTRFLPFLSQQLPRERVNYSRHNTERATRQQLRHNLEKVLSDSTKIAEFLRTRSIRPTASPVRRPNDCRTRESRNRTYVLRRPKIGFSLSTAACQTRP